MTYKLYKNQTVYNILYNFNRFLKKKKNEKFEKCIIILISLKDI